MFPIPELNFRRTPVVLIITAIAAAIEAACILQDLFAGSGQASLRDALYTENHLGLLSPVWSGELWRPLTTALLHGSPVHAAFNIYWMLVFGGTLERRFGSARVLGLIVVLGYVTMMAQFVFSNRDVTALNAQHGVVGLSGILFGFFGILIIGRRYEQPLYEVCNDQTALLMGVVFLLFIVADKFEILKIGNVAHAVGLSFGLLYGAAIFERSYRWLWIGLSVVATLLALSTLFYAPYCELYQQHRAREAVIQEQQQIQKMFLDVMQQSGGDEK